MRASDADRDEAIGALRERFAEGRLSHETFMGRVDAALHAKDHTELEGLFTDLQPAVPVSRRGRWWRAGRVAPGPANPSRTYSGPPAGAMRAGAIGSPAGVIGSPADAIGPRAGVIGPAARTRPALRAFGGWLWRASRFRLATVPRLMCLPPDLDGKFIIGREPACDFVLTDLSVSRHHARLHHEDGVWLLCDLGSTNGTRLNGWRVTKPVPVRLGDHISLGAVTMIVADRPAALDALGAARAATG